MREYCAFNRGNGKSSNQRDRGGCLISIEISSAFLCNLN
jgi:hypothetical protein